MVRLALLMISSGCFVGRLTQRALTVCRRGIGRRGGSNCGISIGGSQRGNRARRIRCRCPGLVGVVGANEPTVVPLCEVVVDVVVDGAWLVVLLAVELVLCDAAALALVLNAADRDVEAAKLWLTLADVDAATLAAALNESAML